MIKVSVIIPVWGVEKYIEKCVRSVFSSTLDKLEIIIVDDCTPDNSIAIIKRVLLEFPMRKESTIFLHHKVNRGLPQARKTGLSVASGEYITFCDSDDWVDISMYEKMYTLAKQSGFDLVHCDFTWLTTDRVLFVSSFRIIQNSVDYQINLLERHISNAVWNKIVKRTIFEDNEFYFPNANMDEDNVYTVQVAYYAKNIGYLHESLYFHYQNPNSITMVVDINKKLKGFDEVLENNNWIIDFFKSKNDRLLDYAIYRAKLSVKDYIINKLMPFGNYYKLWRDTFPEINSSLIFGKHGSFKFRIGNLLLMLRLYPIYHYIKKIIYAD